MAHFIYRVDPTRPTMLTEGPTEREGSLVREHFMYLQGLIAKGTVLLAGRTDGTGEKTWGIVVLVADDEVAARAVMEQDPAVKNGVMRAELSAFRAIM